MLRTRAASGNGYQGLRIAIEGRARTLLAHDDARHDEWGASGSIQIGANQHGRGLSLTVTPTWGNAASGAEWVWGARDASGLVDHGNTEPEAQLGAEIGYGLRSPHGLGLVTPYAGLSLTDSSEHTLRTGLRWKASDSNTVGLEAIREDRGTEETPKHALRLRAQLGF